MKIRFWGTQGSVPTALPGPQRRVQIKEILTTAVAEGITTDTDLEAFMDQRLGFALHTGYGGE